MRYTGPDRIPREPAPIQARAEGGLVFIFPPDYTQLAYMYGTVRQ